MEIDTCYSCGAKLGPCNYPEEENEQFCSADCFREAAKPLEIFSSKIISPNIQGH